MRKGNAEVIVILILLAFLLGSLEFGDWVDDKLSVINLCSKYVINKGETICVLRDSLTLKENLKKPDNVVIKDLQDYLSFSSPEKSQEIQEIINDLNKAVKKGEIKCSLKGNKNYYTLSATIPKTYLKRFYEYCKKTGEIAKMQLRFNTPLIKENFSYSLGILPPGYYSNMEFWEAVSLLIVVVIDPILIVFIFIIIFSVIPTERREV